MGGWGGKRSGPAGSWFLNKSRDKQWIQRRTEGKCFHRRMYYVLTEQNYIPDVWACCCFMDGFLTHRGHWEVIGAQAATGNGFCSQVCSLLFFLPTATCAKKKKKKIQTWARLCWRCPPRNSGKDLVEVGLDLTWLAVLPPLEIDLLMRCSGDWTRTVSVALPNSLALRHLTLLHYPPESTDKSFAFLTFRLIACLYLTNHSVAYELCN